MMIRPSCQPATEALELLSGFTCDCVSLITPFGSCGSGGGGDVGGRGPAGNGGLETAVLGETDGGLKGKDSGAVGAGGEGGGGEGAVTVSTATTASTGTSALTVAPSDAERAAGVASLSVSTSVVADAASDMIIRAETRTLADSTVSTTSSTAGDRSMSPALKLSRSNVAMSSSKVTAKLTTCL